MTANWRGVSVGQEDREAELRRLRAALQVCHGEGKDRRRHRALILLKHFLLGHPLSRAEPVRRIDLVLGRWVYWHRYPAGPVLDVARELKIGIVLTDLVTWLRGPMFGIDLLEPHERACFSRRLKRQSERLHRRAVRRAAARAAEQQLELEAVFAGAHETTMPVCEYEPRTIPVGTPVKDEQGNVVGTVAKAIDYIEVRPAGLRNSAA